MQRYMDGLLERVVCPHCRRRTACEKRPFPKVLPENIRALREYGLMKALGGYGGMDHLRVRTAKLFMAIQHAAHKRERAEAMRERKKAAR